MSPIGTIGDVNPDYPRWASGSTLSYRTAHLYFLFNWQKGGDDINLTSCSTTYGGTSSDYAEDGVGPHVRGQGHHRMLGP